MAAILVTAIGIWASGETEKALDGKDPGEVVIDEVAGYLVTMLMVPVNLWTLAGAFVVFRLFDILKPWPIGWLDKKVHGGLGIMLDDLLAGLYGLAVMWLGLWGYAQV